MTIGELLQALGQYDSNQPVRVVGGKTLMHKWGCDRGNYYDFLIGIGNREYHDVVETVGELIELINDAKDVGTMIGHKGGDFPVNNNTRVKVGYFGMGNPNVNRVYDENGYVILDFL